MRQVPGVVVGYEHCCATITVRYLRTNGKNLASLLEKKQEVCGSRTTSVIATVTDNCDECDRNTLYLSPAAYNSAFSSSIGTASAGVTLVPCEPPAGITVIVREYRASEGGYLRLTFLDVAEMGAVTGVSLRASDSGDWQPLTRSFGANWDAYTVPTPPLDLRLYQNGNYVDLL